MFPIFYLKIMFPLYIAEVICECLITLRIFSCIRGKYIKFNTTFVIPTSILEGSTSHYLKYNGVYKGKLIIKIKFKMRPKYIHNTSTIRPKCVQESAKSQKLADIRPNIGQASSWSQFRPEWGSIWAPFGAIWGPIWGSQTAFILS